MFPIWRESRQADRPTHQQCTATCQVGMPKHSLTFNPSYINSLPPLPPHSSCALCPLSIPTLCTQTKPAIDNAALDLITLSAIRTDITVTPIIQFTVLCPPLCTTTTPRRTSRADSASQISSYRPALAACSAQCSVYLFCTASPHIHDSGTLPFANDCHRCSAVPASDLPLRRVRHILPVCSQRSPPRLRHKPLDSVQ